MTLPAYFLRRLFASLAFCGLIGICGELVAAEPAATAQRSGSPWGISSSASSFRNHEEWFPKMMDAGVTTIRLFPEWSTFEPKPEMWNWSDGDRLIKSAIDHKLEINAILMGSRPGSKSSHTFPMDDLDGWSRYVSTVVGRYKRQIHYWEVWNEGNGGFNDGHHTTTDYARLAIATYEAARKADPKSQIGLTVASFDAPYLHQAIRSMAAQGKPNCFDFLCIHPYEIADGLSETDGEVPFLWMNRILRSMLKAAAPERANAEIWMTEVGHRLVSNKNRTVTEHDAAVALARMYTMAVAQGITCTQWFEAQDPAGEDQGFGLLKRDGSPRAAYRTMKVLSSTLGQSPRYQGWLALGDLQRGYGFVFAGETSDVLVAWMPTGLSLDAAHRTVTFGRDVGVTNLISAVSTKLSANTPLVLSEVPVIVAGLPEEIVQQARDNSSRNFPWGGDYTSAKTVSFQAGQPDQLQGVTPRGRVNYPTVTFADGSAGLVMPGDINHPISFYVHPSFAGFQVREYYIRATVRRLAAGNVGMNLRYEVADSQGRMPYANVGQWFGVSQESNWQTHTWHVKDACFSKMWGNDIVIAPEQSIPFALGKVEVSIEPFQ